jgi:uncharacterized protein with HEPN domain
MIGKANNGIRLKFQVQFAAMENLDHDYDDVDIIRAWETVSENIKASSTESLGYCEMKQWFDEECSKLSDQRKQVELQ